MASEQFLTALISAGSICVDCELCGRTHFASATPGWFEDGELERLQAKAKEQPDKYIEHEGTDTVHWGFILSKQVVADCECKKLDEIEKMIWRDRFVVIEFYQACLKLMKKRVAEEERLIGGLPETVL